MPIFNKKIPDIERLHSNIGHNIKIMMLCYLYNQILKASAALIREHFFLKIGVDAVLVSKMK